MPGMRRRGLAGGLALGAVLASPALAADVPIGAVPLNRFTTSEVTMAVGDRLVFTNQDALADHNVTSVADDQAGTPLFATPTLSNGQSAPARGADQLPPGTYGFFCTLHPTDMRGTLTVTGAPDTKAPEVTAALSPAKISSVLKRGSFGASVVSSETGGATLRIRGKGVTVAKGAMSLKAGTTTARVKLTKAGRRLLKRNARLSLSLTVTATDVAKNATTATVKRTYRK